MRFRMHLELEPLFTMLQNVCRIFMVHHANMPTSVAKQMHIASQEYMHIAVWFHFKLHAFMIAFVHKLPFTL